MAAFASAFVGSAAMWWIYFNIGAERGSRRISQSSDPGRLARLAYTYMHLPLVAGIIVAAVGDELVLAHPTGHTDFKTAATSLGGPALYLVGNLMFKRTTADRPALSHLVGLILLAGLVPLALLLQPLAFAAAANAVLVLVAVWETRSLGTGDTEPKANKLPTGGHGRTGARLNGGRDMHTLRMVVGGLAALGVFILAATLLGRRAADGARIFILPWLAAAIINMVIGVYWAGVPLSTELPVLVVVFGVPAGIAWYLARWLRARAGT